MSGYNQYSTFTIDNKLYGVDVLFVQEIVKPLPVIRIPSANAEIDGLINL